MLLKEFIYERIRYCDTLVDRHAFESIDLYNDRLDTFSLEYCVYNSFKVCVRIDNIVYQIDAARFMDIVSTAPLNASLGYDNLEDLKSLIDKHFVVPYTVDSAFDFLYDNQDVEIESLIDKIYNKSSTCQFR